MRLQNIEFIHIHEDQRYSDTLPEGEEKTYVFLVAPKQSLRAEISVSLEGRNAKAQLLGIIIPQRNIEVHLSTTQLHKSPDSVSVCLLRSLVLNDSLVSYQGNIFIGKRSQGSDAFQHHDSMLLSWHARVQTRPILEILHHAVSCKHGVSMHPIPDDVLWYAKTRLLHQKQIERIYVDGFIRKITDMIPDSHIRDLVYNQCRNITKTL